MSDDSLKAVVLVLGEWAWAKVWLDWTRKIGCPLLTTAAIVEFRRANRVKRQLDADNQHTDNLTPADVGLKAPTQMTLF